VDWYPHLARDRPGTNMARQRRLYDHDAYLADAGHWNVVKYVHVAAAVSPFMVSETVQLEEWRRSGGHPDAIVGGLDPALSTADNLRLLDQQLESSGCVRGVRVMGEGGVPGAEVLLWTFAAERTLYTSHAVGWPANGRSAAFDANFSTSAPRGDVPPLTQFNGQLFARDGQTLPAGTRVEAYVGDTRCGVASTRRSDSFSGYILNVVGPESIAGCARGATLTFRIDGRPAADTNIVNTPPGQRETLDLTVR